MESLLEVKSLCKSYGKDEILKNINLKVNKGDIYGLIGPNGAGKTTVIKSILGLIRRDKGEIYFDGKLINSNSSINKLIGATIEEPAFYEYLSGFNNLKLHANMSGIKDERIDEVLKLVRLTEAKNKKVGKYSLGMKQRLAIARAFINKPQLVILDEPTNGLDPNGIREIREFIKKQSEEGVTFIYCSHILSEVQSLCNRIALIQEGKIVEEDYTNNMLSDKKKIYVIKCNDRENLGKYLRLNNIKSNITDGNLEVDLSDSTFSKLNQVLASSKYDIIDIYKKSSSLENIFVHKVGGTNDKK
ncbi:MAG: ATP-binding cassette domain-containing protein [Clostridiaceae bacterium]|nr:ATP-binding cassette domain-containing protein [Clostridiaceae bacterium]